MTRTVKPLHPAVAVMVLAVICLLGSLAFAQEAESLLLRAENLAVLPKSKPILYVRVANRSNGPIATTLSVDVPSSWRISKLSRDVELAASEEARLGFPVAEGDVKSSNSYPITMTAQCKRRRFVREQEIAVASAPYFTPTIDGDPSDWKDAIPVTFSQGDKKTTIATYWNRRQFSILVSVEEDKYVPRGAAHRFDAVQVALAPRGTATGHSVDEDANRFEYLVFGTLEERDGCCQLARPGVSLAEVARPRSLNPLMYDKAEVAIKRAGGVTHYEFSLPLASVRDYIRPSEGREFYFSVLVHDPDGTGIRDWGVEAGLWESQRNRLAWSDWEGAQWDDVPPMDCRTQWGMCSSKY
ncbi:MAG: hypothetical protein ACODAD_14050 [Planctomycetota bacterium]